MNTSHSKSTMQNDSEKREVGRREALQISGIIVPDTGCITLPQTGDSTNEIYTGWR